ncbi:ATPase, vacuolar ER assembly factor, Vma12 [Dillenia turbinata]|uniref:ATPase, vacuolar ER assembly factor, Vma12 n=1 Tax=Dillenia turbinata TaxID=194707 RepID=A0AAN8UXG0_9MAGN
MAITTATVTATTAPEPTGLKITNTETIRSFLIEASTDRNLSLSLRQTASSLSSLSSIPYKQLRSLYFASSPSTRPDLIRLLSGSNFVFNCPKPREKSEELKARLRKLAEKAERREYEELVKDITPRKEVAEPFSSYKDQMGFGLHVAVTMFSGYLVGYAAFRAIFNHNPAMNAAGGILGLVCAMLVETLLFIIRTSNQDLKPPYYTSKLKKDQ